MFVSGFFKSMFLEEKVYSVLIIPGVVVSGFDHSWNCAS